MGWFDFDWVNKFTIEKIVAAIYPKTDTPDSSNNSIFQGDYQRNMHLASLKPKDIDNAIIYLEDKGKKWTGFTESQNLEYIELLKKMKADFANVRWKVVKELKDMPLVINALIPEEKWKEDNKEEKTYELKEKEILTINSLILKKWDKVELDNTDMKVLIFTWKYKKIWDKVTDIELVWLRNEPIWFIKIWIIKKYVDYTPPITPNINKDEKKATPKKTVAKSDWGKGKANPDLKKVEDKTSANTKIIPKVEKKGPKWKENDSYSNDVKEITDTFEAWRKTTMSADWLSNKEEIAKHFSTIDIIYTKLADNLVAFQKKHITNDNPLAKQNSEWIKSIYNEIALYNRWEWSVRNQHFKNPLLAEDLILWILSKYDKPPKRPTEAELLSKLDDPTKILFKTLLEKEEKKWISFEKALWIVLWNPTIKWAWDKVIEKWYNDYENGMKVYIEKIWKNSFSTQEKFAYDQIHSMYGMWWWFDPKDSTKAKLVIWRDQLLAIWLWIAWAAATATWIWSIWWGPLLAASAGMLVWWLATTWASMVMEWKFYSKEELAVEWWINVWTFMIWWLLFKFSRSAKVIWKIWVAPAVWSEMLWNYGLWISADQIKSKYYWIDISLAESLKNNLPWALLPLIIRWTALWVEKTKEWFSKARIALADKTAKRLREAGIKQATWDTEWATNTLKKLDSEIKATATNETTSAPAAPAKPAAIELSFFQKSRADDLIFESLKSWKKIKVWWVEYEYVESSKNYNYSDNWKTFEISKNDLKKRITNEDRVSVLWNSAKYALKVIPKKDGWHWKQIAGEIQIQKEWYIVWKWKYKANSDWEVYIKEDNVYRKLNTDEIDTLFKDPKIANEILSKTFPKLGNDIITTRQKIVKHFSWSWLEWLLAKSPVLEKLLSKIWAWTDWTAKNIFSQVLKPLDMYDFARNIWKWNVGKWFKILLAWDPNASLKTQVRTLWFWLTSSIWLWFVTDDDPKERKSLLWVNIDDGELTIITKFLLWTEETVTEYAKWVTLWALNSLIYDYYMYYDKPTKSPKTQNSKNVDNWTIKEAKANSENTVSWTTIIQNVDDVEKNDT